MCPQIEQAPIEPVQESDEIDVTEIIERIEKLETENSDLKARLEICENSIDKIADLIGKLNARIDAE